MKKFLKKINFIRTALAILTICPIAAFVGVFQILIIHNRIIKRGVNADMNLISAMKNMQQTDKECQDQLCILKERISILYEFHRGETIKPEISYLDD